MRHVCLLLLCGSSLVGSGCFWFMSRDEGVVLRKDVADLRSLSTANQQRASDLARDLEAQTARLKLVIDQATHVLERNSADTGQTVEKLQQDMAALLGRVDDLVRAEDALTKQFQEYRASTDTRLEQLTNEITKVEHPPTPDTADAVWDEATRRSAAGQFPDARRLLDAFINRYPQDPRAPRAQIAIGDAYVGEKRLANAVQAYTKVLDNFPKSEVVVDAMYKAGQAFYALKYCSDAKVYFSEVQKRFPSSAYKKDIQQQLKNLVRDGKNKAVCTN